MSGNKSLRKAQKDAILTMLNLNAPLPTEKSLLLASDLVWKVLIYDTPCQEIISPLLKVNELREYGVTVHMQVLSTVDLIVGAVGTVACFVSLDSNTSLNSSRDPIPDVAAVYFIQPTVESIKKLTEDISKKLYDSYYINFATVVPRFLLEQLASAVVSGGLANQIAQVYDQYLNYICLSPDLFTLNLPDTYAKLHSPTSPDSLIETLSDRIASSLFSVFVTLGVMPVIRAPSGNAAGMIAAKLDEKFRDSVNNSRNSLFSGEAGAIRPVLILLDRNMDLTTMLQHTWTYSTLVHDILEMKLNRVVAVMDENGRKVKKVFDIDPIDFFWKKNAGTPFPKVAEDVDGEINRYKKDVDEITKSGGVSSLEELDPNAFGAKGLKDAISALPELTERKRIIDMHMNLATALLKSIQERSLDTFFEMEETITRQTKAQILELIKDVKKDVTDKLRFFLVWYLSVEDVSGSDLSEYEVALTEAGADLVALNYIKKIKSVQKMTAAAAVASSNSGVGQSVTNDLIANFTSIGNRFTKELAGTGSFDTLISGVKNLLPIRKDIFVTRTVESLMEGSPSDTDDYLYLDPKSPRNTNTGSSRGGNKGLQSRMMGFSEAIVFVVGGGNYLEYQNLVEWASRGIGYGGVKRRVMYGSTELLSGKSFLSQLGQQ
ncbi:hypothetical protein SmJEL517_g04337 [Synchytrium microbalum]|uniref:Sec1-like protein n=1 Tax=Synchytrium microbalum TaxID=1806994 RepID=A0A507BYY7_9FUNG|nr:uncharacterized protein SmJEL517_g04337 [Synchytrium microbalum]TPX32642.1 hypothetical protein SmJEL517_g04337 [Synchytrium microbalum]